VSRSLETPFPKYRAGWRPIGAFGCLALLLLWAAPVRAAETTIAVLSFELNDLTGLPPTAEERARTASIQPLLEKALAQKDRYRAIAIDPHLQTT